MIWWSRIVVSAADSFPASGKFWMYFCRFFNYPIHLLEVRNWHKNQISKHSTELNRLKSLETMEKVSRLR